MVAGAGFEPTTSRDPATLIPSNGLRDQLGADLLGVPLHASDGAGQRALLAGPGVSAQVDVDPPGVSAPDHVAAVELAWALLVSNQ
jgi:hypothetical protein